MHLIITSGELPEQKILRINQEDKAGYEELSYEDLESNQN